MILSSLPSHLKFIGNITRRPAKCLIALCAFMTLSGIDTVAGNVPSTPTDPVKAHDDYLLAISLADEGSKPEALHLLAESLRLQPEKNPAAALAFQLLTELRTTSSLQLRGHTGGVLYASYSPDGTKIVTGS